MQNDKSTELPETVELKPCGLFHTPESQKEIDEYAKNYSGGEKMAFIMGSMLQHNFLAFFLKNYDITPKK